MIDLNEYRKNIFHKSGVRECPHYSEDGVILKIFEEIGTETSPLAIEFGETRSLGTTTRAFRIKYASRAVYFTGDLNNKSRWLNIRDVFKLVFKTGKLNYLKFLSNMPFKFFCYPTNIIDLFKRKNVKDIDVLTVDIDSYDYYIIKAILEKDFSPRLMILEYNFNLPIDKSLSYPFNSTKKAPENKRAYGVSYKALDTLATSYGYKLVHISGFCNLFYVRQEFAHLFSEPNLEMEIPRNDKDVQNFIDKFCQEGFIPSWLGQPELTEKDLSFFDEV